MSRTAAPLTACLAAAGRFSVRKAVRSRSRSWLVLAGIVVFGGLVGALCLLLGLRLASAGSVALWLGVTPTRMRTNA